VNDLMQPSALAALIIVIAGLFKLLGMLVNRLIKDDKYLELIKRLEKIENLCEERGKDCKKSIHIKDP